MVEPEMSRGGRHRNVRICREARGSRVRLSAAYDWRRIHSATPQRNALTCRDGCAFLSGEGSSCGTRRPPTATQWWGRSLRASSLPGSKVKHDGSGGTGRWLGNGAIRG
jgi:hypothetical protein